MNFKSFALVAVFLLVISFSGNSQDSHYSTYQFGPRSALMGGSVLGFTKDNTSIFYNPGSLAFVDSNSITLTANMYQVENYRITNAGGRQKDLTSSQIGSVPLLVSGMLDLHKKKIKIGYGVISPVNFRFKTTSRVSGDFEVVPELESPGNEEFVGQSSINSQLSEVVGILGVGYKINNRWAVGISNMAIGRTQDFSRATFARFYLNDIKRSFASYSFLRDLNYFHLRYVAKLGVCYRKNKLSAGFSVTLPSISVLGSGTITADVIGTNTTYNGIRTNLLANDRQENLAVIYKSPISVATGINWSYHKSTFGLSVQFFAGVPSYYVTEAQRANLVTPTEFYETLGNENFLRLKDAAKPVLNFGFGYEYALAKNLVVLASFRTNRSYYDSQLDNWEGLKTEITTWDLFHLSGGAIIKQGHSQLSIGILYGTGFDQARPQNGEFSVPDEASFLKSASGTSKASYNSVGFLLGYSFLLFDI